MSKPSMIWAITLLAGFLAPTGDEARAQNMHQEQMQRTQGGVTKTREQRMTGNITAIDKAKRTVTLVDDQGDKAVVDVPESMKGFDKLKVGDRVDITYYESLAVALSKPGKGAPKMETRETMTTIPGAQGGTRTVAKQMEMTVSILSVDPKKNQVTFRRPDNSVQTVTVQDQQMREKLPSLKAGDSVDIIYTEAIAASIVPVPKK